MEHGGELPDAYATDTTQSSMVLAPISRRRPIPRKGHRKSRAGCLVCKRRRVKCDEGRPDCEPCRRLTLECRYVEDGNSGSRATVTVDRPFRTAPVSFTLDDLRFFQHFLSIAYPSLPSGDLQVWQQVGQMVQQYDFLAHATLGLGASHLDLLVEPDYSKAALQHRVAALSSLNRHIKKPGLSITDADAAFAAMLSLTYQAAYMPDGMMDFFTMTRGCFVISSHLITDFDASKFHAIARVPYLENVGQIMAANAQNHALDKAIAEDFLRNVSNLAPLCTSKIQNYYMTTMQKAAATVFTDPAESYDNHTRLFMVLEELTAKEFSSFMDPENHVSRLLIMHMLALNFVFCRKDVEETTGPGSENYDGQKVATHFRKCMSSRWIKEMFEKLPEGYRPYAEWVNGFSSRITFSFNSDTEVWKPFLLHMGKALLLNPESVQTSHGAED